jgi:small subunit ribosomal protein S8
MTNDIIADMLTRIRNGTLVKMETIKIPKANITLDIAKILEKEGYIHSFEEISHSSYFLIQLKYLGKSLTTTLKEKKSPISYLERISKPGRRVYVNSKRIPEVLGGIGVAILSTPQGILTDREARQRKIGGEVLCYIY